MRMRFKPYARGELAAWPHYIDEPAALRGHWREAFADPTLPLRLELGCGKGGFLAGVARQEPAFNYLGVDIKSEVLVVAKRTIEHSAGQEEIGNIKITSQNIERIGDILSEPDSAQRIYINFCNPWYKSGHSKHRLTHPRQLLQYRAFLQPEGCLYFKTDDELLFNDTLRYFPLAGFAVTWISRDLHKNEPVWNIRTEHEQMFSEQGILIKACVAQIRPGQLDEEKIRRMKTV